MAHFIGPGTTIDYTPGVDVPANTVIVQGELVGVTLRSIKANVLGALCIDGMLDFPKASGGSTAIAAGALCYWDAVNTRATTTVGANKLIGKCVKAAVDGDTTVRIRLRP